MKRLVFLIIVSLSSHFCNAQLTAWGPKVGLNYSSILINETFTSNGVDFNYVTERARPGLVFGGYFRIYPFKNWFMDVSLMWSQERNVYELSEIGTNDIENILQDHSRVDLPLLFGWSKRDRIRPYFGLVYSRVITDNNRLGSRAYWDDLVENFNQGFWGLQAGFGFDISPFTLEFKYEFPLSDITGNHIINNEVVKFSYRPQIFQITLGIDFVQQKDESENDFEAESF